MNSAGPGGVGNGANVIRIDIGGTDPLTGKSFSAVAAQSRSMHKTQGFGGFSVRGGSGRHRSVRPDGRRACDQRHHGWN